MTGLTVVQIVLLTLLAVVCGLDPYISGLQLSKPAIAGFLAGLIMGDIQTGLFVGSTLQLMVLGVGTFGGASIPDFASGAIIGTALGVVSGKDLEFAIGLSVPVGLLMVQLDILARFCNVFFLHRIDKHIENKEFYKINREAWFSLLPIGLSRAFPVAMPLFFGNQMIEKVTAYAPEWLMGGLRLAGATLPVVGIAILLRYLPVKKFIPFLLIGYLLAAYLHVPMMGIALFGAACAALHFNKLNE
ncbi:MULTISPECIES: PTS sugar transporter subunit IIC [unclassified Streptococcus]|uniref:PTS mannose/fructose/sorbose/N-acetylgalactosamine transporter subunit IIC n=1 Tax=unclassified Streptococcus TaxID=2608887 RepID=UPI001072E2CD|nr:MULTISPECIES: PTS sugar transporter subunit IIC [unclassified Streptococcus]MBF0787001.1 PTS sugar transporter subunit IIC [Streptococcus sp. 19428wC2_LYSM12]MCQ9212613.1 PTS sugar transporter subunit IIC [Streptococcus sp. B01]MCQ9213952.1 PTS sugar transporter subunit IIC [Streptococcus sp. O1]TFV06039.1 PTS sugar transporter subunit IIC [Streptococcus sp. LYSM12]